MVSDAGSGATWYKCTPSIMANGGAPDGPIAKLSSSVDAVAVKVRGLQLPIYVAQCAVFFRKRHDRRQLAVFAGEARGRGRIAIRSQRGLHAGQPLHRRVLTHCAVVSALLAGSLIENQNIFLAYREAGEFLLKGGLVGRIGVHQDVVPPSGLATGVLSIVRVEENE